MIKLRTKLSFTATIAAALLLTACGSGSGESDAPVDTGPPLSKPNVVLILADDLGYGSLNSYGASRELVRTPHIDRLAEEGVRFTQANSPSSVCSPTRYGVLMGRYLWRTQHKFGLIYAPDPLLPDPQSINLAHWLKARGYTTATIGKWHLGYGTERHEPQVEDWRNTTRPGPEALGFDYSFNVPHNHGDTFGVYFENGNVVGYDEQEQLVGLRSTEQKDYGNTSYGPPFIGFDVPQRRDERVTEQITTRAIAWMQQQVTADSGPFFLYFTPVAVHNPITPSPAAVGTSGAGPYGDFIHDLDKSVGRVLDALDELGVADNTVVIFTSDNGGKIRYGNAPQILAVSRGLAINGSLRGDKATIWEGGTRVPLIVRMPDSNRAKGGRVSDALVNLTDVFATIADVVGDGAVLPKGTGQDSISFRSALQIDAAQGPVQRTNSVTANESGILAIRSGDWKWIEGVLPEGTTGIFLSPQEARPQLYNLRNDPAEVNDVSSQHADVVARLRQELQVVRASD